MRRYPLDVMPAEGVGGVTVTRDDLVLRARSGDHDAFDVLARSVTARLYAIALRILRDVHLAEDQFQDSLVDGWRDLRALRDPALFDALDDADPRPELLPRCQAGSRDTAAVRPDRRARCRITALGSPSGIAWRRRSVS